MTPKELKDRTEEFSRAIVRFCTPLLDNRYVKNTVDQLLRSGTAVDSNYGSAQCGRSHDEFTSKIGQVWDDARESHGWLKLLQESDHVAKDATFSALLSEASELTKIFAASFRTAKREQERRKQLRQRERRSRDKPISR